MIRKMLAPMTAVGLALTAGTASADEWTGTITEIDETAGNIVVTSETAPDQEEVFTVSDTNTVGATLADLKEGDKVTVFYADDDTGDPMNAMQIDKVEE